MAEQDSRVDNLIIKYMQAGLTNEENKELNQWLKESEKNRVLFNRLTDNKWIATELEKLSPYEEEKGWQKVGESHPLMATPVWHPQKRPYWWYAAAIVISLAIIVLLIVFLSS